MKFSINRNTLLEELSKANKIIDIKNPNPALGGIFLELGMDKMTIISTNGTLAFKSILNNANSDLDINQPGKILIKGRYILEMLRKLDEEFVTFTAVETSELRITTQKSEFNINILDAEDYPMLGFREKGITLELDPKEFKKNLSQVAVSINEYNKKLSLTGMNLKVKEGQIIFSGTDLHRISRKIILLEGEFEQEVNITIPFKTINELPKLLDGAKNFKIVITEGYVTFIIDEVLFQSNLIDGQFPNIDVAFPQEFDTTITVESRKILKALNRADLPNDDGLPPTINLKFEDDKVTIKSTISEVGNYEEVFGDFESMGNLDLSISFNAKFLTDALRTFEGEVVEMKFTNALKPVVINKLEDDSLKQVVMPTHAN
ncbi:DNA polymerase III subunit beta [[Acholeplasma] multilocale]|uniref:DNA polymerase III subunit beta n=1 Tax=[Acholeplasma] multilocale TaxID=264638 RepID=UPI000427C25B|nr:DNA polymerase III subunit beta [[Acholeplasma] multilocale]